VTWLDAVRGEFGALFVEQPLVLVDVGASGAPPEAWRSISALSTYVGFDPDLRELSDSNDFGFARFVMMNKAVTDDRGDHVVFHLTASPFCSSVLEPNPVTLNEYVFTDLFAVERTVEVAATTLDTALTEIGLDRIDWLKLDTQGKDLDIVRSLEPATAGRLLALDIEPGVDAFYQGENTFAQSHAFLLDHGFWLTRAHLQRFPRIARETRERLSGRGIDFSLLPGNPTAVEAQYYRTRTHLMDADASLRDYVALWIIAMVNGDLGFAFDVAVAAGRRETSAEAFLVEQTARHMVADSRVRGLRWRRAISSILPSGLRPVARRIRDALGNRQDL